ncbi:MAG: hypothetical protein N4R76_02155 [Lactobacillus iners]|jgi:hypothetical protein|nr:hypothetical protein [Lactobacillus iners]
MTNIEGKSASQVTKKVVRRALDYAGSSGYYAAKDWYDQDRYTHIIVISISN